MDLPVKHVDVPCFFCKRLPECNNHEPPLITIHHHWWPLMTINNHYYITINNHYSNHHGCWMSWAHNQISVLIHGRPGRCRSAKFHHGFFQQSWGCPMKFRWFTRSMFETNHTNDSHFTATAEPYLPSGNLIISHSYAQLPFIVSWFVWLKVMTFHSNINVYQGVKVVDGCCCQKLLGLFLFFSPCWEHVVNHLVAHPLGHSDILGAATGYQWI